MMKGDESADMLEYRTEKQLQVWKTEQEDLLKKLELHDRFKDTCTDATSVRLIGGVDISFIKGTNQACASLIVLEYPSFKVVYSDFERVTMDEPYIAGFLAFREVKFLVGLFQRLRETHPEYEPDVCMVDGNGVLHPKGMGLASHLGILVDCPTIGVAKTFLHVDGLTKDQVRDSMKHAINEESADPPSAFSTVNLVGDSGRVWGAALCPQGITNPIYISQGHRISLPTALLLVQNCCQFRIPEPVRQADILSRQWLRDNFERQQPSQNKPKHDQPDGTIDANGKE